MMSYEGCVEYILQIPKFAKKTTHENLGKIMESLGNPQKHSNIIHVAGTNGKGSTCAFLSALLQQKGKNVGLFTSPHLILINERFRINDQFISNDAFVFVFHQVYEAVQKHCKAGGQHPNFFEFLFIMASIWFRERKVDYIIYETGLGGRLDATNIVSPRLCILTSIGMDHMEYLGDTLEKIAGEKAGILKSEVPVVYWKEESIVSNVIESRARELRAKTYPVEKEDIKILTITDKTIDFSIRSRYDYDYSFPTFSIRKTALYQLENAALAVIAFCHLFQGTYTEEDLRLGLRSMHWEGRMEQLAPDVYVDGAHNDSAIIQFCNTVEQLYNKKQIILLFAVANDKSYNEMIMVLCRRLSYVEIIITSIEGKRNTPVEEVASIFAQYSDTDIYTEPEIEKAYLYGKQLQKKIEQSQLICVGSLYLVGSIKRLEEEKND